MDRTAAPSIGAIGGVAALVLGYALYSANDRTHTVCSIVGGPTCALANEHWLAGCLLMAIGVVAILATVAILAVWASHSRSGAPAGWYADPWAPGHERWWDGAAWTPYQRPR